MATWKQPHDNPMSAIEELIERVDKAEADRDRLVEALRSMVSAYDAWSGHNDDGFDDDIISAARAVLEGL